MSVVAWTLVMWAAAAAVTAALFVGLVKGAAIIASAHGGAR
jgi:hypothetical protein